MSKYFVIAAALMVFAVACNKKEETAPVQDDTTVEETIPAQDETLEDSGMEEESAE